MGSLYTVPPCKRPPTSLLHIISAFDEAFFSNPSVVGSVDANALWDSFMDTLCEKALPEAGFTKVSRTRRDKPLPGFHCTDPLVAPLTRRLARLSSIIARKPPNLSELLQERSILAADRKHRLRVSYRAWTAGMARQVIGLSPNRKLFWTTWARMCGRLTMAPPLLTLAGQPLTMESAISGSLADFFERSSALPPKPAGFVPPISIRTPPPQWSLIAYPI